MQTQVCGSPAPPDREPCRLLHHLLPAPGDVCEAGWCWCPPLAECRAVVLVVCHFGERCMELQCQFCRAVALMVCCVKGVVRKAPVPFQVEDAQGHAWSRTTCLHMSAMTDAHRL
eukprot:1158975-Pelagomonas_calceolata.AAC.1